MRITKMPRLTATASKTKFYEGEKMIVTVTNERAPVTDLTLKVSCDHPERVTFPETVVMVARSTSVSFEVEALQDTDITDEQIVTITVAADDHYAANCEVSLLDDDRLPTVQTNKAAYKPGETVLITGQMFGPAAINAKIAIYVVHNGKREMISTKTDDEGKFTAAYNISASQSGHFNIEVCYAGEAGSEELASFETFGLQLSSYNSEADIELGTPASGTIIVTNTVPIKQTGLKIEQRGDSVNCAFTFTVPEDIEANGTVEIAYTITPNAVSEGTNWQQMPIEISTTEGSKVSYTFYYYVQSALATLLAEPSSIETTMTKGATREYPLVITNTGKGETGTITLGLPDFMNTATPRNMPSLASGESTTILLELTPTDNMTLNVPVTGNLAINCENANGLSVGFSIEPVSVSTGTLTVDVTDELTYYAETVVAPHVKDAKIEIKHPVSYEVVANGTSNEKGLFDTELAEGLYLLEVSAPKHETFRSQIMIDPGKNKSVEAFLSYQNVTYDWNVEETDVEDTYNLELVADYDVRIPKPALITRIAIDEQPFDGTIIPIEVTNKGLININDVNVTLAVTPEEYSVEFLTNPHLDYLAPQQTETFYAQVKYNGAAGARKAANDSAKNDSGVKTASNESSGSYPCGDEERKVHEISWKIWNIDDDELADIEDIIKKLKENLQSSDSTHSSGKQKPGSGSGETGFGYVTPHIPPVDNTKICFNPTDPDDPNNPNAPNDPIDLDIAPSGDPNDDADCDGRSEPTFVYNLVPVSGTQYKIKGVAADGVSQLKIVLDPKESHIPKEDCESFTDFEWYVREGYGKIEGSSFREAIYTAPDSFPENNSSYSWMVEAQLIYTHHYNSSVSEVKHVHVNIEIIRPPVVFIHGLNDTEQCWREMDSLLIKSGLYRDGINFRLDYSTTNTSSFNTNVPVVGLGIQKAQRRALCKGYVATKCDLVGHSMGGILARLYVQNGATYYGTNTKEVNRIITVNTPHAGSEIADCVMGHKVFIGRVANLILNEKLDFFNFDIDKRIGAIKDLAVESEAIENLNANVSLKCDVPVISIATSLKESSMLLQGMGIAVDAAIGVISGLIATAASASTGPVAAAVGVAIGVLAATYAGHIVGSDLPQVGVGDWVVSTQSQVGGCRSNIIIEEDDGTSETISGLIGGMIGGGIGSVAGRIIAASMTEPWHVISPKHKVVMDTLKILLSKNANDSAFSKLWFAPEPRYFDHDLWWLKWGASPVLALLPFSQLKNTPKILKTGADFSNMADVLNDALGIADFVVSFTDYIVNNISSSRTKANTQNKLNQKRILRLKLNHLEGFSDPMITVAYEKEKIAMAIGYDVELQIPSTFSGNAKVTILMKSENDTIRYADFIYSIDQPLATPVSLTLDETTLDVDDSEPLRLYCTWNDGTETKVVPDEITFEHDGVAALVGKYIVGLKKGRTKATASYRGLTCDGLIRVFAAEDNDNDEASESVCSKVTLSFKQEMVTTRQAFRGTLAVNNGSGTRKLKDLKLNLEVKDEMGNIATEHEFQIDLESLDGFEGELDFTSGWSLNAESKGTATILFVPTKYAAQTEPKKWWFGGTFSYTDPDTDLTVTRELYAVPLTVNPTPELDMDYFLQRDVFGDDPLTEDVVENCQPAEFALLINNKGYGDAQNVSMVTHKPEIVDNEKGLLIDFDLLGSQLNGREKTLAFGKTIPSDFGSIPAHTQAYAQWWLQSPLLGHFTSYNVNATHVTSRDNPDLSLLDQVKVHELIHGFTVSTDGDKPLRGFLVNDIKDNEDKPDAIYFTDATQQQVNIATSADIVMQGDNEYVLTVNSSTEGWYYGSLLDPTNGQMELMKVTRADGTEVYMDNIWQTDRTLRDGKDPFYENRLHFIVNTASECETLHLIFEPKEDETTGLLQLSDDLLVRISPLPLRDNMRITGNFKEIHHVSIYDMRGVKIFSTGNIRAGQSIHIGKHNTGIYYIQVATDKGTYRAKVQKR